MSRMMGLLVGLCALLAVSVLGGDHGSSLWPFAGRFHPLLVHLPIGVLLLAVATDVLGRSASRAALRPYAPLLLLCGAWSAIAAGIFGLVLADWGSYAPDTLLWHKRLGIAIPVLAVFAYWLRVRADTQETRAQTPASIVSAVLVVVLVIGAHLGGTLSRGDGYLTRHLPEPVRLLAGMPGEAHVTRIRVFNPESTPVYDSLIQPMLTARCGSCHNPDRKKGGLILTTADGLFAGGRQGKVILPGRAEDSELVIRLGLPTGHTDAMPPDRPVAHAELALVRWWIDQGASRDVMLSAIERPASIRRTLAAYGLDDLPEGIFAREMTAPDASLLTAARTTGLTVQPLGANVGYVSVDAASVPAAWVAGTLTELRPLAQHVASVDLARTKTGDEALATLGTMPHLTRLQLAQTLVTDVGLQSLRSLEYLEYLNLTDTKITDSGLRALEQLPRLRALYLWGTGATTGGVARLQRALPRAAITLIAPVLRDSTARSDSAAPRPDAPRLNAPNTKAPNTKGTIKAS